MPREILWWNRSSCSLKYSYSELILGERISKILFSLSYRRNMKRFFNIPQITFVKMILALAIKSFKSLTPQCTVLTPTLKIFGINKEAFSMSYFCCFCFLNLNQDSKVKEITQKIESCHSQLQKLNGVLIYHISTANLVQGFPSMIVMKRNKLLLIEN